MRAVIQRVRSASVWVEGRQLAAIGKGLLVFIGIGQGDDDREIKYIVDKTLNLRIFEDSSEKLNLSIRDVSAQVLLVSQFTLYGDARRGRRPSFTRAMAPNRARSVFERVIDAFDKAYPGCKTGQFQAMMDIKLVNDGPVTIMLDSDKVF